MGDEMHEDEDVEEGNFGFSAPEEGECILKRNVHSRLVLIHPAYHEAHCLGF